MHGIDFPIAGQHFALSFSQVPEHFHVRLIDADQRCVFALFLRQQPSLRQSVLVLNSQRPDGTWCDEISCKRNAIGENGLTFDVWPWHLRVISGDTILFSLNPERVFGAHTALSGVRQLETTIPLHLMSFQNQSNVLAMQAAAKTLDVPAYRHDYELIVVNNDLDFDLARELDPLRHLFSRITILPADDGNQPGEILQKAIGQSQAQHLVLVSLQPDDTLDALGQLFRKYASGRALDRILLCGEGLNLEQSWICILPRMFQTRVTAEALDDQLVLDQAFLARAFWLKGDTKTDFSGAMQAAAKQRFTVSNGTQTSLLPRCVPQVSCFGLGIQAPHAPLPFSGFAQGPLRMDTDYSLRELICFLRDQLRQSWSTHLCLTTDVSPETLSTWHAQALGADAATLATSEGDIVGFSVAATVLPNLIEPFFLASISADMRDRLETAFTSAHDLLAAFRDLLVQTGLEPYASVIENLPKALSPDKVSLQTLMAADYVSAKIAQFDSPKRLVDSGLTPESFENFARSALALGLNEGIVQVASVADETLANGFIASLVACFEQVQDQLTYDQQLAFARVLSWRNYYFELGGVLDLMDKVRSDFTAPQLALLLELRIRVQIRDVHSHAFSELPVATLRTAYDLPDPVPQGLLNALCHYRATRGLWDAILNLFEDLDGAQDLTGEIWRYSILARIELGQTAGLEQVLARAEPHLDKWNMNRLRMRVSAVQGDVLGLESAVSRLLKEESDMSALTAPPTQFARVSGPKGPLPPDAISCVIVARNEYMRLKWLFDYYRRLGVDHFFLIDNMSDDATLNAFGDAPDITILQTEENYRDSRYGVKWHNEVSDSYLTGRWVLTVDADEVLVFEGCETPGALKTLCQRLDEEGAQGLFTTMVDMYSGEPLDEITYRPGDPLTDVFDHFDKDGYWYDAVSSCPGKTVSGGVRTRLFWNNRHAANMPHLSMQKAPLVKWKHGFRYLSSTHEMTPCKISAETGALLHFKFLPDFHARALEEVRRQQHFEGAREYMIYAERLKDPERRSLRFEGSVRYEGVDTLIKLGLVSPRKT